MSGYEFECLFRKEDEGMPLTGVTSLELKYNINRVRLALASLPTASNMGKYYFGSYKASTCLYFYAVIIAGLKP